MVLFRRKKSASETKGNASSIHINNSGKEKVLQRRVNDLQEEMKCLNKQLVAIQTTVQKTDTVNYPTPGFSPKPKVHPRLRGDQFSNNKSIERGKRQGCVFVPQDIEFVSNDKVCHGKSSEYGDLHVSSIFEEVPPLPIEKNVTRNCHEPTDIVFNEAVRRDGRDVTNVATSPKKGIAKKSKHAPRSSPKDIADVQSTTSSIQSISTERNRQKVRRIVRKVRAAPSPQLRNNFSTSSTATVPLVRNETKTLPWTTRNYVPPNGLSTKRPISSSRYSQIKLSDVFLDEPRTLFCSHVTKDDGLARTASRETLINASHRRQFNSACTVKNTEKAPGPSDRITSARNREITLDHIHYEKVEQLDKEIVVHRPNIDTTKESKQRSTSSSLCKPIGCGKQDKPFEPQIEPRSTAQLDSKMSNAVLEDKQIDMMPITIQYSASKSFDSKSDGLKDAPMTTEKVPSTKSGLLADIRSGITLNKVKRSTSRNLSSSSGSQQESNEDVKQTNSHSSSRIILRNPKNDLLAGIKAGVKLKHVDRSSSQEQKNSETPMSALLKKIKERKEECLHLERSLTDTADQSEIDW